MKPRVFGRIFSIAALILVGTAPQALAQSDSAPPQQGQNAQGGQRRQFRGQGVFGKIQSVSATELKLAAQDGSTVTVAISSKTQFRLDQQPAKPDDFKIGSMVFVRGSKTGDAAWDAEVVSARTGAPNQGPGGPGVPGGPGGAGGQFRPGNVVAGTVKSIDGTKLTILRLDGSAQTIELDENTSLQKHRESITLADIHAGDPVAVRGETKDGAFSPKTVNVLDPAQFERMKQFLESAGPAGGAPPSGDKKPGPETKPQGFR